jgi:hypothetical protein
MNRCHHEEKSGYEATLLELEMVAAGRFEISSKTLRHELLQLIESPTAIVHRNYIEARFFAQSLVYKRSCVVLSHTPGMWRPIFEDVVGSSHKLDQPGKRIVVDCEGLSQDEIQQAFKISQKLQPFSIFVCTWSDRHILPKVRSQFLSQPNIEIDDPALTSLSGWRYRQHLPEFLRTFTNENYLYRSNAYEDFISGNNLFDPEFNLAGKWLSEFKIDVAPRLQATIN